MPYPVTDPDASFTEAMTSLPPYNSATTDPIFFTEVRRVSDDTGDAIPNSSPAINWGDLTGHDYFKKQNAWNCDDTRLLLTYNKDGATVREAIVLNASTYEVEKTIPIDGNWDVRWHHSDPDLLYFVRYQSGPTFGTFNVETESTTTLFTFSDYQSLYIGPWEGNFSDDGRWFAFHGQLSGGAWRTGVFDTQSLAIHSAVDLGNWWATDDGTSMISKLGNYVIVNTTNTDNDVYDRDMNFIESLSGSWTHGDMGLDGSGDEVYCAANGDNGRVRRHRLSDGNVIDLTTSGFAENVSCRSGIDGWCWVSYPGRHLFDDWPPYGDELLRVKMDGSRDMIRLAHLHASYVGGASQDYYAEPHPIPSRDGSKVIFRSLWEGDFGSDPIHAFVVIEEAEEEPPPEHSANAASGGSFIG